jgi:GTP-binding protein
MFIDTVSLSFVAGNGGNGIIAWRREKYIPKGGPAGGDGGNGGSIIFVADIQTHSLEDFRNRSIIKAQCGNTGGVNNRTGKNGQDLVLKVPCGTLIKDPVTKEILHDLTENGQRLKLCAGGIGGKGNSNFVSSTHQAPFVRTEGTIGQSCEVELELKLIADVGFVGMPNAGKSTLISNLARIDVKIAPYPFTTLRPNLGIVEFDDYSRILIADIPGIIEDASDNRGLGLAFLRHIERSSTLVFLIELSPIEEDRNPFDEFLMLRKELESYSPEMLQKPFLVVLNKIDQEGAQELADGFRVKYPFHESTLFEISAKESMNLDPFLHAMRVLAQRDSIRYV